MCYVFDMLKILANNVEVQDYIHLNFVEMYACQLGISSSLEDTYCSRAKCYYIKLNVKIT